MDYQIFHEDCIEGMKRIADGSIDAIIADPPFGTTDSPFDIQLPVEKMWEQFNRVTKPNAAIVLFAQLPFAVDLINANRKMFRYEWIFEKSLACGFFNAKRMPLRAHENILVFYRRLPTYNPQFRQGKPYVSIHGDEPGGGVYRQRKGNVATVNDGTKYYPRDVQKFTVVQSLHKTEPRIHPTQKPVALMEFLVKTYTNEYEIVLDATMGSGSTGVACMNTRRRFIGFEKEQKFFDATKQRLDAAIAKRETRLF